ncbi:hypothetical protein [Planobispora longispora]|uniref:Uncharacterized protein n=1 Tax=Planobispora longispora TaxID=28887 RepID=A0A8J3RNF4_9ACTN|nr:hypothetical protein [Planobispora longispora]BFE82573.1 hypothetical protein GCM10020093_051740 [Planobispora longispora]GIH77860.1 hypothetical protein Plo01_42890 [Planobispora longispora]
MTFYSDRVARRTGQVQRLSLRWVLVPFFCCGGLPIPFVVAYMAYRLRSHTLWIIAGACFAVEVGVLAASSRRLRPRPYGFVRGSCDLVRVALGGPVRSSGQAR